jgi:CheY-like chemotaxis protein
MTQPSMAISGPPHSGPSVRLPRVLLVDDDQTVLRALRRMLLGARPHWQIDMAESPAGAISLLASSSYDVLVTDLHMPGAGGRELLERLKTERPSLIRVIHSSHVESLTQSELEKLAHGVLRKPADPSDLIGMLEWAIDQRRRRKRDSAGC